MGEVVRSCSRATEQTPDRFATGTVPQEEHFSVQRPDIVLRSLGKEPLLKHVAYDKFRDVQHPGRVIVTFPRRARSQQNEPRVVM